MKSRTIEFIDDHRAIALARFTPKLFITVGRLVEDGVSDDQILLVAQMGGMDDKLVPVLNGAIRHIRRQMADARRNEKR